MIRESQPRGLQTKTLVPKDVAKSILAELRVDDEICSVYGDKRWREQLSRFSRRSKELDAEVKKLTQRPARIPPFSCGGMRRRGFGVARGRRGPCQALFKRCNNAIRVYCRSIAPRCLVLTAYQRGTRWRGDRTFTQTLQIHGTWSGRAFVHMLLHS